MIIRVKQTLTLIAVLLFMVLLIPARVYAYNSDVHDKYLIEVLFGNTAVRNTDVLDALNAASAIAIDQHNNDGQNKLDELKNIYKIKGLPSTIDKFNVNHGHLHRNYTHKGWDYDYKNDENNDEAHWADIRKEILLKTVNQSFDFGFFSGKPLIGYSKQCEGLAALIYYVHVLGDHLSNETYNSSYKEIPLIKGNGQYGIIEDLKHYSELLFSDHTSRTYKSYILELDRIKDDIRGIYHDPADLEDTDTYKQYHRYAEEIMQCLKEYVPLLIKKENFFQKVFYPELIGK